MATCQTNKAAFINDLIGFFSCYNFCGRSTCVTPNNIPKIAVVFYRSGSRVRNWHLYPRILQELARTCKVETGRVCLLTHDRKCLAKVCLVILFILGESVKNIIVYSYLNSL